MEAQYGSQAARNLYRLAMHLTLIAGSIMFSMPFVWMASTSLKEDDEQMTEDLVWIPRQPPYQPSSPYLDAREGVELVRPVELNEAQWRALEPTVLSELGAALKTVTLEKGATPDEDAASILRAALWRDLVRKISVEKLTDSHALAAEIKRLASQQIARSHRRVYRAMALADVSLRGEGEAPVRTTVREGGKSNGAMLWQHAGGAPVTFHQYRHGNKIEEETRYDFKSVGEQFTLSAVVPYNGKAPLKGMSIAVKSDASWNRMWYAIELNGERYESTEPYLLGGSGKRFGEVFYQMPSPDDLDDMKIQHWISTGRKEGSGYHNQAGTVKLELAIENTSAFTKFLDKASYNYNQALRYIPFWRYLGTSIFLVAINVFFAIFSSSLIAYAFARLEWPGRNFCWALLLATVMIPAQVTMIPQFLIIKWLGWYNTLRPLWIGSAFGSVFFVFMLRQFMKGIPKDLEDAAKIDGCNYWQIYWNVILPLVKPTLAAIGIFTFMHSWNDFMGPLMYLSEQKSYPLSLGLFAFQTVSGTGANKDGMLMAASLMMTLPVIALFFIAQKQFIQGVTFTGIKG